jgi:hypothetical protein
MVVKGKKSIAPLLGVPESTLKRELSPGQGNPKKYPVVKEGGRYFMYLDAFEAWKAETALKDGGSVYDALLRNVCELERIAPQTGLLAGESQYTQESAVGLTDSQAYELVRIRRLLGTSSRGYLNRGDLAREVQSALSWALGDAKRDDPVARREVEAVLALIQPYLTFFKVAA